jgi:hypothetical protein
VSADRQGNIFFFRGETFDVYPLDKTGAFQKPVHLETIADPNQMVHDAVLSPSGDRWLIYGDATVRLFQEGKEKALPLLPWKPWSITFLRDTPVVAVLPLPMGGPSVDLDKAGTPPTFLTFDGERWQPAGKGSDLSVSELIHHGAKLNEAVAERSVYITGDRLGRLWAAGQYRYRIQRFAPGFRPNLEVLVRGGQVRQKKAASKGIEITRKDPGQNPSEATRNPLKEKSTYSPFTGEQAAFDLTEGRDGRIYLLVRTEAGEAALDRFDPSLSLLERLPLDLKAAGRYTMAAGQDGLYLAAWNGDGGRWRISWETLDQASWAEVDDCEVDGVSTSKPGADTPANKDQGRPMTRKRLPVHPGAPPPRFP